jgi:hypothetical protein
MRSVEFDVIGFMESLHQSMSRKKLALGLDPRVGTGFAKKIMLKRRSRAG